MPRTESSEVQSLSIKNETCKDRRHNGSEIGVSNFILSNIYYVSHIPSKSNAVYLPHVGLKELLLFEWLLLSI